MSEGHASLELPWWVLVLLYVEVVASAEDDGERSLFLGVGGWAQWGRYSRGCFIDLAATGTTSSSLCLDLMQQVYLSLSRSLSLTQMKFTTENGSCSVSLLSIRMSYTSEQSASRGHKP